MFDRQWNNKLRLDAEMTTNYGKTGHKTRVPFTKKESNTTDEGEREEDCIS